MLSSEKYRHFHRMEQKRCSSMTCPSTDKAEKLCGRCRITRYCSLTCQRNDWKFHRKSCCMFEIQSDQARSNGKDDKFEVNVQSTEELIQLFHHHYQMGSALAGAQDTKKRIKHYKRAVYLEDIFLKRADSDPQICVDLMSMLFTLGGDHASQRPATVAIRCFQRAIYLSKSLHSKLLSLRSPAINLDYVLETQYKCHIGLGNLFLDTANVTAAGPHCMKSLRLGHHLYGGDKLPGNETCYIKCLLLEGRMQQTTMNFTLAVVYVEKAYDCLKRTVNVDDDGLKSCTESLIRTYLDAGLLEKANVLLTDLLERLKLDGRSEELVYAGWLRFRADCLIRQRNFSEAAVAAQEAINIFAPYHCSFSEHYGPTVALLAQTRLYQQQLDEETETLLIKAFELESALHPGSLNIANLHMDLGLFYLRTGDVGRALERYEAAHTIALQNDPDGPQAKTLEILVLKFRAGNVEGALQFTSHEYV